MRFAAILLVICALVMQAQAQSSRRNSFSRRYSLTTDGYAVVRLSQPRLNREERAAAADRTKRASRLSGQIIIQQRQEVSGVTAADVYMNIKGLPVEADTTMDFISDDDFDEIRCKKGASPTTISTLTLTTAAGVSTVRERQTDNTINIVDVDNAGYIGDNYLTLTDANGVLIGCGVTIRAGNTFGRRTLYRFFSDLIEN